MSLRDRLRRLERLSEEVSVSVPQPDGPSARFPESELKEAFLTATRRLCGDEVAAHPLGLAAARSPDPTWSKSFYADDGEVVSPPEDLSEGAGCEG